MKFIKLTYFRSPIKYGTMAGRTKKKFLVNPEKIISITEYTDSTRIDFELAESVEVCETIEEILNKIG